MKRYEHERQIAIEAVLSACRLCSTVQHRLTDEHKMSKIDTSPVTVADFGSQALVVSRLRKTFAADPIVGEEEAAMLRKPEQQALKNEVVRLVRDVDPTLDETQILAMIDEGVGPCDFTQRYWTLDPIDGTKGFLRGEQYAIALALIEQGEPVLGVLGCPNLPFDPNDPAKGQGVVFIGVKGEGAFIRALNQPQETRIQTSMLSETSHTRMCDSVEKEHSSHSDHARIAELLGMTAASYRLDSQAKYGVVARGEADMYLRIIKNANYHSCIWDHAAGVAVVKEAGGEVTDAFGNQLDFSVGRRLMKNSSIIVTNGMIHNAVLHAVQQIVTS